MNISKQLEIRRQWFGGGYSLYYEVRLPTSLPILSDFIDYSLRQLLPHEVMDNQYLTNVKGRDSLNLIHTDIPIQELPTGDEIIFLSGLIHHLNNSSEVNNTLPGSQVRIKVNSRFRQFVGNHSIEHSCAIERFGDYSHDIPIAYAGRVFPFTPTRFRLGLDFFESKFLSSMFGFAPTVTQSLLIEADSAMLSLRVTAENLRSRRDLPLQKNNTIMRLNDICAEIIGYRIIEDFNSSSVSI